MAVSTKYPVLTLSTVKPNGLGVQIDDETYETMAPASWGAEHSYEAREYLNAITSFENKMDDPDTKVTPDEVKAYKYNLRAFVKFILPNAPAAKIDKLSDNELGRVVKYFLSVLRKVREVPSLESNGRVRTSSTPSQESVENTPVSEVGKPS